MGFTVGDFPLPSIWNSRSYRIELFWLAACPRAGRRKLRLHAAGDELAYGVENPRRKKAPARASDDKRQEIRKRAGELAMNQGKPAHEPSSNDITHAERELLGLQTLPNPDDPSVQRPY